MNLSNPVELALLQRVYSCRECVVKKPKLVSEFTEARPGMFHKFPPLIGCAGKAKLLFVGYNPRRTTNVAVHDFAVRSLDDFCTLSNNTDHHGQRYIGSSSSTFEHERHYDLHNDIVQRVFGKPFEQVAAVTEMYLCASRDGKKLNTETSPCAQLYLSQTIKIANPDYIVTFGSGLPRFFSLFLRELRAGVLHLPFPSKRTTPTTTMAAAVEWVVQSLLCLEQGEEPPRKTWRWPKSDATLPHAIMRYP